MDLPKYIVIVCATEPPTSVMTASSASFHYFSIQTSESMDPTAPCNVHPASGKKKNTAHGELQHAKRTVMENSHNHVAAVHLKPTIDKGSQMQEHTRIQSDATEQLTKGWKNDVAISE